MIKASRAESILTRPRESVFATPLNSAGTRALGHGSQKKGGKASTAEGHHLAFGNTDSQRKSCSGRSSALRSVASLLSPPLTTMLPATAMSPPTPATMPTASPRGPPSDPTHQRDAETLGGTRAPSPPYVPSDASTGHYHTTTPPPRPIATAPSTALPALGHPLLLRPSSPPHSSPSAIHRQNIDCPPPSCRRRTCSPASPSQPRANPPPSTPLPMRFNLTQRKAAQSTSRGGIKPPSAPWCAFRAAGE